MYIILCIINNSHSNTVKTSKSRVTPVIVMTDINKCAWYCIIAF